MSTQLSWMKFERNCVRRFLSGVLLGVVMIFAFEMPSVVFAPHCELHLYFIKYIYKYIFSQHQPFTNKGEANVTKKWYKTIYQTIYKDYVRDTDGC